MKKRGQRMVILEIKIKEAFRVAYKEKIAIYDKEKLANTLSYLEDVYGFPITSIVIKNLQKKEGWFNEKLFDNMT